MAQNEIKKKENELGLAELHGNFKIDTIEDRINLYNLVANTNKSINDILGKKVKINAFHLSNTRLIKPDTVKGYEDTPRIVFFLDDGSAVITFSIGIYLSLKRVTSIFGDPPYDFYLIFNQIEKGKNRIYTIDISKE